ncbi:hypothetical protein EB118_15105 [bacterium]|nr:hypothetical protein [bacterium]NDD82670.1 hypothetical protein [bacterium]NDG31383.1 hypothetical protein [bacterium]
MQKIRGKKVLIKKPVIKKESLIEFTPAIEAQYEKDMIAKYSKLEVAAVGSDVTDIKSGDLVYVGAAIAHSEVIQIEEEFFFLVPEHQVSIIW